MAHVRTKVRVNSFIGSGLIGEKRPGFSWELISPPGGLLSASSEAKTITGCHMAGKCLAKPVRAIRRVVSGTQKRVLSFPHGELKNKKQRQRGKGDIDRVV